MDTLSLYYFIESAKDLNFSKTAARLFISQQNLSNHIFRLEQNFGISLYERKPKLSLTYAGECLLQFAQDYKISEENVRTMLDEITLTEQGRLNIGCSPHRTAIAMPLLAEKFVQDYPHVNLNFCIQHSNVLSEMLLAGELDFAIAVDKCHYSHLETTKLFDDSIYLMVSKVLLSRYYREEADSILSSAKHGIDLRDFSALPFVNIKSAKLIKDVFESCQCTPYFSITVNYPQFSYVGFYENIAASIITKTVYLNLRQHTDSNILFLPVNTPATLPLHSISFMQNRQKRLSRFGQHFKRLTIDYFNQLLEQDTNTEENHL